jgi:PAS domain S-box-containing protein
MSELTTSLDSKLLLTRRENSGVLEEGYFDFTSLPVIQDPGTGTNGVLEIAIDRTKLVVDYRQMNTLVKLSNSLRTIHHFDDEFWRCIVMAFDDNPMDSPMLILYRTTSDTDDSVQLQRAIGVASGGVFAPHILSDEKPAGIFQEDMRKAKERNAVVLSRFPEGNINSAELNSRGIGECPSAAAVIPIQVSPKATYGFLILGINPLRPMGRSYKRWLDRIRNKLAAAATGIWSHHQEIARAANMQHHGLMRKIVFDLKRQATQLTEALRRSELSFTQTLEALPVGVIVVDMKGLIHLSNYTARKIFGVKCDEELNASWTEHIYHEDRPQILTAFEKAIQNKENVQIQHRIGNCEPERGWEYWVSSSIIFQVDERTGQCSG